MTQSHADRLTSLYWALYWRGETAKCRDLALLMRRWGVDASGKLGATEADRVAIACQTDDRQQADVTLPWGPRGKAVRS